MPGRDEDQPASRSVERNDGRREQPALSLNQFAVHQLMSAPRPVVRDQGEGASESSMALFASLVAAHGRLLAADEPAPAMLTAWVKAPEADGFRFFVGARPEFPGVRPSLREQERDAVLFPPGCLGDRIGDETLADLLGQYPCWLRCPGQLDVLWREQDGDRLESRRGTFVDYVAHLGEPFVWLIVAEPLAAPDVDDQLVRLMTVIPRLRQRVNSEPDRVDLERSEARYRELAKARVSGLWEVHVLVGAMTPSAVRTSAALLCAASEIDRLPYALTPGTHVAALEEVWTARLSLAQAHSPLAGSAELLGALTAPPARELPGIRLVDMNAFDVTPESDPVDGIALGTVLDRGYESAGTLHIGRNTLNRHTFVAGATGGGKSQTTRWLLERLARDQPAVPWLVIEPAKAEYARMAGRLLDVAPVIRITPGDPDTAPASLNPLEPAPGFPLQSHLDLIRALFLAAFEANEPFPQVLAQALSQAYRDTGWDLVTGEPRPASKPRFRQSDGAEPTTPRYPRLDELQAAARRVVDDIGYGTEVTANVKGFIDVRIASLVHGTPGRFFQGGHPLDIEALMGQNVVFELEEVTDDHEKAFVMGAIIIRLVEHLRVKYRGTDCDELRHILVIEEAHRLLKRVQQGPAAAAVDLFASLLAEIRAYGDGIVVVEQIPSKIISDVIKNTALKIVHRLPALDDREAVGGTMNLSPEQSRAVVALRTGTAAVAVDGMDRPVLVRMESGATRETEEPANVHAPLLARRSALCGKECQARPCTLREMNDAMHCSKDGRWVIWAEVVTIAYLTGFVPPLANDEVLGVLRALPARTRACALSYAAESSVAARRHSLRRYCDPSDFEELLYAQLRDQAEQNAVAPVADARRWQAGPHRYRDVKRLLRRLAEDQQSVVVPEVLAEWAQRGLHLTARQPQEILDELEQREARELGLGAVILGDPTRSGLADAIRVVGGSTTRSDVLRAVSASCIGDASEAVAHTIAGGLEKREEEMRR